MSPAQSSAKALQGNRTRPTVPKPVVPAIPLPFIQKRKQQSISLKKPDEVPAATSQSGTQDLNIGSPSSASAGTAVANGSVDGHITENQDGVASQTLPLTAAVAKTEDGSSEYIDKAENQTEVSTEDTSQSYATARTAPSEGASSAPRPTYQMPPPFYPAGQGQPKNMEIRVESDSVQLPSHNHSLSNQQTMHHPHPSNGSLVFGGHTESNNSSPAPPPSSGSQPPYMPNHLENGRSHGPHPTNGDHQHQISNGSMPVGPPVGYYPRQDNFTQDSHVRRQMVSFAPAEGYSPSGTPFGVEGQRITPYDPLTPHSFHGSQSSIGNEHEAGGPPFYGQYPTAVISNGNNGHIDEVRLYQQPRPKPRAGAQAVTPGHGHYGQYGVGQPLMPHAAENFDGLVNYIQSQFADPTFADYTLELRYSDDRAPPVRIPGHNLMLARSPKIKAIMTTQARESNSEGHIVRQVLIESDDRFLRSDAFWMAVQRLYGLPLLDIGAMPNSNATTLTPSGSPMPGTPADRFDLALGYTAAGKLLEIPPVIHRGIEIASNLMNWLTLEKALDFALDGGLDPQWTIPQTNQNPDAVCPSTYGPAVNMLIHSALNFTIRAFPPTFELDVTAGESVGYRRLPVSALDRPATSDPRLSFIRFGDHSAEEGTRPTPSNSIVTTLSSVLINLPFYLLKYVLESARFGGVDGWATTTLRKKVMHAVVEERERRRIKIRSMAHISNAERTSNGKKWEVVGWKEGIAHINGNADTPTLTRTWVDFTLPENGN
ncbi:hypothetical protein F5884DRAFT_900758 [Xylogone sp. PMI_703]|nr:hypothetical protein F5884DRAFT_900758 [Xylogone sp. PMI_703]